MRRLVCSVSSLAAAGLCALAVSLVPDTASAAQCGTFVADEGDNLIFYGLQATTFAMGSSCVGVRPEYVLGNLQAVVCWRDAGGQWHLEDVIGCNSSSPAGDQMLILGAGGDDVVMPVIHRGTNDEFVCPVAGTSGTLHWAGSTPASFPVYEWYGRSDLYTDRTGGTGCVHDEGCSYLDVGVAIYGGLGEDELHGAPEDDQLLSSDLLGDPWCQPHGGRGSGDSAMDACVCASDITCCNSNWDWDCVNLATGSCGATCSGASFVRSDQSQDILCGHGGTDVLLGDQDPEPYDYELLSGGPGTDDFCRGIVPEGNSACCQISSSPGCSDPAIEGPVCAADPFCCATAWDGLCVGAVTTVAGGDCSVGTPPCCTASTSPGCADDAAIEAAVCGADPYCCSTAWDWICRNQVVTVAGESCDPITDVGTPSCEIFLEADEQWTGDGALAMSVCADDDVESIPDLPPGSSAVITDYRVATDFFSFECL